MTLKPITLIVALSVVTALPAAVAGQTPPSASSPAVTPLRAEATLHVHGPARVNGVVVYSDPSEGLFVQVGNETFKVAGLAATRFSPGDRVHVTGTLVAQGETRAITGAQVTRTGSEAAPAARQLPVAALRADRKSNDWVEFEAVVREVEAHNGRSELLVETDAGRVTVVAPSTIPAPGRLVDSMVRIRGVRQVVYNKQNVAVGVRILAPTVAASDILEPAPATPFALPVTSASAVKQISIRHATAHRVKMQGSVVMQHMAFAPGRRIVYVQDASGTMGVEVPRADDLTVGDRVEVSGFPTSVFGAPYLTSGVIRRLGPGTPPPPLATSISELSAGRHVGRLVRVRGSFLSAATGPLFQTITMQDGAVRFATFVWDWPAHGPLPELRPGSVIEVTGMSNMVYDEATSQQAAVVSLRSPSEIVVIQAASWWTPRHLALVAIGATVLGVMAFAWVAVLNVRVRHQTRALADQFERSAALERRWSDLVSTASDVILTLDVEGRVTSINKAGVSITGRSEKAAWALTLKALVAPQSAEAAEALLRWPDSAVDVQTQEIEMAAADGETVALDIRVQRMFENGAHVGFLAIGRSVADHKRVEQALRQARDAAEEANRAKSEFLANMSHEIRTPMNGIIGMTELALGTDLSDVQREYLLTARASAESLLGILNSILDFSKIESRKLELESVPFSIRDLVGEALKPLGFKADQKGLELMFEVEPDVPDSLVGDPLRLRQILTNLVGNAIKFTDQGHVWVNVREERSAEGCTLLHFAVADTGVGIPKDKHTVIFDPFAQADGSTTRRYGGSGLGLAISATLVRLMGGRVWLESEAGAGSTFHFTAGFDIAKSVHAETAQQTLAGLAVLVVDDNAVNRRILTDQLTRLQMNVSVADNGLTAIEAVEDAAQRGEPFLLVLLDGHMPGLNGFDVAQQISSRPELAGATIMMLTSSAQQGDIERCRELSIAAYLTKPIAEKKLQDVIARVLNRNLLTVPPPASMPARSAVAPEHRRRVLLAEDNIVNQRVAVGLLSKRGHVTTVVANGQETLEALERESFDVVLMDVQMPVMGGLEATVAIRQREAATGAHVRIVAMTAHAMNGDRDQCLSAGMDGYLSKPIDATMLFAVIEEDASPAPVQRPSHGIVDEIALMDRLGDEQLFNEVIELFLEDCPKRLAAIKAAVDRRDPDQVRRAAHTLKGAAGNLSATGLFVAAQQLEELGLQCRAEAFEAAWRQVSVEAQQVMDTLRQFESAQPAAQAL